MVHWCSQQKTLYSKSIRLFCYELVRYFCGNCVATAMKTAITICNFNTKLKCLACWWQQSYEYEYYCHSSLLCLHTLLFDGMLRFHLGDSNCERFSYLPAEECAKKDGTIAIRYWRDYCSKCTPCTVCILLIRCYYFFLLSVLSSEIAGMFSCLEHVQLVSRHRVWALLKAMPYVFISISLFFADDVTKATWESNIYLILRLHQPNVESIGCTNNARIMQSV